MTDEEIYYSNLRENYRHCTPEELADKLITLSSIMKDLLIAVRKINALYAEIKKIK